MMWLSWRQLRLQTAAVYALVAGVAVVVLMTGPRLQDLAGADGAVFDQLTATDRNLFYAALAVVGLAPVLLGAFWGAPLVARELETGTYRLAWTQTVTRTRWLALKLATTTITAAVAVGALSWAATWWARPIDGALSSTRGSLPSRLTPISFAMRGVAPIGYAVFAVVLGVTFGLVLRRSLPAMAITLAVFAAVQVAVPLWVRPHLVPPVVESIPFTETRLDSITANGDGAPLRITMTTGNQGDWLISSETIDAAGRAAAVPAWMSDCLEVREANAPADQAAGPPLGACMTRLTDEGYRQRLAYQPASRFWEIQWAETAVFLAASGALAGFCFWWTRRRLT